METVMVKRWKATVTVFFTIDNIPFEDFQTKEDVEKWLRSPDGKDCIQDELRRNKVAGSCRSPYGGEIILDAIDDVYLEDKEVMGGHAK